jgi:LuxR family maltose regulon positive regulatory protein
VAWVSLDAADSDPLLFWSYVIAALDMLQPDSGTTALALLQSPEPLPIEAVLTPLLNALGTLSSDAVLVLDDYHLIDAPAIHSGLAFLLDHLPPRLHLAITTRADPPLPLTRLRAGGQLTELRAADLRFTAEEAAAFLTELMELPLSADVVMALEARTEGWIAGLQLAALAMRDRTDQAGFVRDFSGSNRFVVDYLAEEVLGRLPAHVQTFLLQTSVLERLCGSLCDAVLGVTSDEPQVMSSEAGSRITRHASRVIQASYSQLVLDQLERTHLFLVPLDDERHWYRYHHLFAEVLRARLYSGATSAEIATLHRRASAWYEREGLIAEAVSAAFFVDDFESAATLIEQHSIRIILDRSDVFLVRTWVEQLPRGLITARPRLAVIAGFIGALMRQFDAVELLLEEAAPALSAPDLDSNIIGELAVLRSSMARFQGDLAGTHTFAQHALANLDRDRYALRALATLNMGIAFLSCGQIAAARKSFAEALASGEVEGQWIALAALEEIMSLQLRQGQLQKALQTSEQAVQLSIRQGGQPIPAAGMGYVGIAEVSYEWNDLAGATQAAAQAIELLQRSFERLLLARAYLVLAQVHQAQGDSTEALAALHRCEEWFIQNRVPASSFLALLTAHQSRLWLRQGNLAAAAQWAQEYTSEGDTEVGYVQQLTLVRLWLAQSHNHHAAQLLAEANRVLEDLILAVEARGWMHYVIEGLMLQSLVCQKQGERIRARTMLERALRLAEPEGYVRIFMDEGAPMAELLAQIANDRSAAATYAAKLLAAFPRTESPGLRTESAESPQSVLSPQSSSLVEPLSPRELEILRLIAEGHSNQAIADTLIIAVSTVKRHVNNIYGKLDVRSRTQALLRARELKLL